MAKRDLEADVERVSNLRDADHESAVAGLTKALADSSNLVIAKAAQVASARQLRELIPAMLRAYERLFENPVKRDSQCWGKNALAKAFAAMDHSESAPYLRGMAHIQMEPVWGGVADTAHTLRAACLLGLAACNDLPRGQIFRRLVDGLTDSHHAVRTDAARALVQMEGDEAALALRLKARLGDQEDSVTGQVFECLLRLEGNEALPFIEGFLTQGEERVREEAALAIGSSRLPGATAVLIGALEKVREPQLRETIMRALAASRQPEAIERLLSVIRDSLSEDALAALEALAPVRETGDIRASVKSAVQESGSSVQQRFRELFPE